MSTQHLPSFENTYQAPSPHLSPSSLFCTHDAVHVTELSDHPPRAGGSEDGRTEAGGEKSSGERAQEGRETAAERREEAILPQEM